jgi:hypothetical protein
MQVRTSEPPAQGIRTPHSGRYRSTAPIWKTDSMASSTFVSSLALWEIRELNTSSREFGKRRIRKRRKNLMLDGRRLALIGPHPDREPEAIERFWD